MEAASTNVLLVEDEQVTSRAVERMLGELGYRVQIVESAEQALSVFTPGAFAFALSDVNLPGMDGLEMLRRIKALDPSLVPLVMTSRQDTETAMRALECGVRSFLIKPFTTQDLKVRLDRAAAERRSTVETRRLLGDLLRTRSNLAEKVQEQERYMGHLVDAAPFAVLSTDRRGQVLTFNRMAERMYGYTAAEVIGGPVRVLTISAEGNGPMPVADGAAKDRHRHRDGHTFPVFVHQRDILNDRGQEIAHLYVVADLTEREQIEDQLLYAEKLSLLGQMAPRIAHEFKAPLQLISGHAELTREWLRGQQIDQAIASVQRILPAVDKMLALVRQMSELGRPKEPRMDHLDLAEELQKTLDPLMHLGVMKHCRVDRNVEPGLPRVQGDPAQLEQVFRNLIVNAAQAMDKVSTRVLSVDLRRAAEGGGIEVTIGDTGPGMPPEVIERIFEPFFTTKPEGTGLGLPIVRTVLDRHHASVAVSSEPGVGTRFVMTFPPAPAAG
jgi:two-component system sensor histidine kinase AtoS